MRILIITHAPLSSEFGAGQMALNLGEALRKIGYEVTLWSPYPIFHQIKWWNSTRHMRLKLKDFLKTQQPFDMIDCPAIFVTQQVSKSTLVVVARSVQPDVLYLVSGIFHPVEKNIKTIFRTVANGLYFLFQVCWIFQGWKRAAYILCLGSLEFQWMVKQFPFWKNKIFSYVNAISEQDRELLAKVRNNRQRPRRGIRFLWIGRWVSHKGPDVLLNFIHQRAELCPHDTFTIAGCGMTAQKDCPEKLVRSGRLEIIPTFNRSELYSLLSSHDVGLFTSRVEGWSLSLVEMLESGMLVFATPVGPVPDLQPYFEETLKPFPPPWKISLSSINYELYDNYCKIFSWDKIATDYIAKTGPLLVNDIRSD